MEKNWYVFYTRSRWEKKIKGYLQENCHEVFLPLHKVMRQWSDRKKKVEVPLFNSYIFVKVSRNEIHDVLKTPGIVTSITCNGAPAVLRETEYLAINKWLETGLPLEVESLHNFELGDNVRIVEGPMKGAMGEVLEAHIDTCCVVLESLQQVLTVRLRKELLEPAI